MKPESNPWLNISRRELKILLVAAGMILLTLTAVQLIRRYTWRDEFRINGTADSVALPPRLNINTVKAYELTTLPGIGRSTAELILRYREEKGHFDDLNELGEISGIGDKTINALRPHVMCMKPAETKSKTAQNE